MLLSTTTGFISKTHSIADTVKIIKNAGFDAYDLTFCGLPKDHYFFGEDRLEKAKELRAYADSLGIVCNQAHAPFPSSVGDPERDEAIFESIVRSMEVASVLGAKIIVVHPKQHLIYAEHAEELFEMNVEFYERLMPYAKKLNVIVATENMWQWNNSAKSCTDSTCSRAWEFNRYIDAIGSPYLTGCLDLGHVGLVGADLVKMIKLMGGDRIKALHVHDNDKKNDSHTLPYASDGTVNWDDVTAALKEIGYQGDLTYEADSFMIRFPAELYPDCERLMHAVGRHLIKMIEQ
jgi:sugar phosphate isomerase/epimerase